jgi:Ca2+-binding EF-hand superfamily protein
MKRTVSYLAAITGIVMSTSLALADGDHCDENMHGLTHTQAQAAGNGSLFSRLDTNGDGVISKAEFDAFNDRHFKNLDVNNDGKITPEELQVLQARIPQNQGMGHGDGTTHLDQRFYAADANHDGGLDREEAINMPMLSKYFDEVDSNKDGKVTRQEYFDAMPLLHGVKKMDIAGKAQSM